MQSAVDRAAQEVEDAVMIFDSLVMRLRKRFEGDESIQDVEHMILGCQYACTANLDWRYGIISPCYLQRPVSKVDTSLKSSRYKLESLGEGRKVILR